MVHGAIGARRIASSVALRLLLLAALAPVAVPAASLAQADLRVGESQVKAAYLLQFLNYVEWPPKAFAADDSPFAVGVAGDDAVAGELAAMAGGRTVQGRRIEVRRLRNGDSLAGLHVLYIGSERAGTGHGAALLAAARTLPLLVVTDSEELFARGGTVQFVTVDRRVRFDVALRPAEDSSLRISSRLLGVARRVLGTRP